MLHLKESLDALRKSDNEAVPSDKEAFWAIATSEAAMRVFPLVKHVLVLAICVLPFAQSREHQLALLTFAACSMLCCLVENTVNRHLKTRPIYVGCAFQLLCHLVVAALSGLICPSVPNELFRHRLYLTCAIPILFTLTVVGYLPPLVFGLIACPIFLSGWLAFHYTVGFLNPLCVLYGMSLCTAAVLVSFRLDKISYRIFQLTQELETERALLQASEATLKAMLSSIFDASAFCNSWGKLSQVTPQLKDLLGNGRTLHSDCLWDYASSQCEQSRLREFLEHAAETATHQAAKIHVLLKCDIACSEKDVCHMLEVSVYAIKLTRAKTQLSSHEDLFLGFQVQSIVEHDMVPSTQHIAETSLCEHITSNFAEELRVSESLVLVSDSSDSCSQASTWSICPSDLITAEAPEFSDIYFVFDAVGRRLPIQCVAFNFSDLDSEGQCIDPPAVADFMPRHLFKCFTQRVQDCLNTMHSSPDGLIGNSHRSVDGPVFLQLPSHLTGADEVMLRADCATLKIGHHIANPDMYDPPTAENSESDGTDDGLNIQMHQTEKHSMARQQSERATSEGELVVTLQLQGFSKVNVPRVNPKRLFRKSSDSRRGERQQLPVIQESSMQ
jgi:hypothetical protein